MSKRRDITNPFPGEVPDRVVLLLFAWARWHEGRTAARGIRFPQVTFKHELAGGSLVQTPGFCLERATTPKEPTWHEDFTAAFWGLAEDQRAYALAFVAYAGEPWLKGERWTDFFTLLRVRPRAYEKLLKDALRTLSGLARQRGLV